MSKRRDKNERSRHDPALSAPDARSSPEWLYTLLFAIGTALYLAVFFAQRVAAGPEGPIFRSELLSFALAPEELVSMWVAGDSRQFTILDRLPIAAMTAWFLLAAFAAGDILLRLVRAVASLTGLERFVLAEGIGLNLLSLYTLAVGLLGGLHQALWLLIPYVALTMYSGWQLVVACRQLRGRASQRPSAMRAVQCAAAGVFTIAILLGAMLPPWDFDVREYHLQVPKEWYLQGRITFLPHNVYGNMPLGSEMHALTAMCLMPGEGSWWWGALAGKTVMATFAPLAALAIYAAGRRFAFELAGAIGALVYISHPWIAHVSASGLNEGALAFYVLTGAYAALLSRETPRLAIVAGFLAGAAAACKYTGLVFVVAPLTAWMLFFSPAPISSWRRIAWKPVLAFALAALAGGGLWYAKNAALTGNPTYPLLYRLFDGKSRTPEKDAQWKSAHAVPRNADGYRYSLTQMADSAARVSHRSELASPLVFPLTLVALGVGAWGRYGKSPRNVAPSSNEWIAIYLIFILAAWWLMTHRLDRFFIPALPLAALLAGVGGTCSAARPWKFVIAALFLVGLIYNAALIASPLVADNRWFVALETLRNDPGGSRVSTAHHWLNEHIKPGEAVLLVGDAQPFDLEMPVYYNTCFDDCLLVEYVNGKSVDGRRQAFRARNLAYVLVDWAEIRRYRSPGNYGYDPRFQPALVDELVAQKVLGGPIDFPPQRAASVRRDRPQIQIFPVVRPAAP